MGKGASLGLLLILFSGLSNCASGIVLGFSYDARMNKAVSAVREAMSLLRLNGVSPFFIRVLVKGTDELQTWSNTGVNVDLFLDGDQLKRFKLLGNSWRKTDILGLFPHARLKSIVVGVSSHETRRHLGLKKLGSHLKSIHSVLNTLGLDQEVKLYLAYTDMTNNKQLKQMAVKKKDGEVFHYNHRVLLSISSQLFRPRASKAIPAHTPMIVTVPGSSTSPVTYSSITTIKPSNDPIITPKLSNSNDRKFIANVSHDVFPTTPVTNPTVSPVVVPPESTTPMIVTVPGSGTSPVTPTTPLPAPGTHPPVVPITPVPDPNLTPVPVATPVTTTPPAVAGGMQPVTNPVTTPSPVPSTVPVASPATASSSPSASGQTWCVVKTGVQQSVIQAALDYACGIGGADCSMIQQGASCFNPSTLQNHASYAFNSYYQKNPAPPSCNFGGAAMIVNSNPSSGTCVYPASSSSTPSGVPSSTSPTTVPVTSPTTVPTSTPTTVPTTSSSNGGMVPGASVGGFVPGTTMSPPTSVNSGDPGSLNPAIYPDSPSGSISAADSQSSINSMLLAACLVPLAFLFDI